LLINVDIFGEHKLNVNKKDVTCATYQHALNINFEFNLTKNQIKLT